MSSAPVTPDPGRTFRLPKLAYLIVVFLLFCVLPLAFADTGSHSSAPATNPDGSTGTNISLTPRALLLLIPLLAIVFIARTATTVNSEGVVVRAAFGRRRLGWADLRGLELRERAVYAVLTDGAVRLPCVRVADLAAVSKASGGRLPEIAEPRPKFAPSRRRRR